MNEEVYCGKASRVPTRSFTLASKHALFSRSEVLVQKSHDLHRNGHGLYVHFIHSQPCSSVHFQSLFFPVCGSSVDIAFSLSRLPLLLLGASVSPLPRRGDRERELLFCVTFRSQLSGASERCRLGVRRRRVSCDADREAALVRARWGLVFSSSIVCWSIVCL